MAESRTFRALRVIKAGELPVVENLEVPTPGKNQILVRIHFAPINPSDLMNAKGLYPSGQQIPFTPGFEGSGVVEAVGTDLLLPHKVGDRVSVIGQGTWGEYVLLESHYAVPILPENTLEEAASHFVNPCTVICMVEEEVLKGGHKAVIHTAGSSALGRMLIKYLKQAGVKSINIVRKDDYKQELLDIGADYVLNSSDPEFTENLKKISHEVNATLCFEAVGGDLFGKVLSAMPRGSHVLSYGALESPVLNGITVKDVLFSQKTVRGFWLSSFFGTYSDQQKGELLRKSQLNLKTSLKSDVSKVFKYEQYADAVAYYNLHSSKGKILFSP